MSRDTPQVPTSNQGTKRRCGRLGEPLSDRMRRTRVTEADVLEAARVTQGLERMDQIKYAVIEKSGDVSVIPWPEGEVDPA